MSIGGYATSIFMLGWATGGLVFGLLGDRIGRAETMMVTILIYSVFTGLSALSVGFWDFAFYRFLTGWASAASLPSACRCGRGHAGGAGRFALGLLQALSTVGNIAAAAISLLIPPLTTLGAIGGHGVAGWRWLFVIGIVPGAGGGGHSPDAQRAPAVGGSPRLREDPLS